VALFEDLVLEEEQLTFHRRVLGPRWHGVA
jgi:hypothetical protein